MRTTLTLDPDVARSLQEKAKLEDRPFKQVVNEAIRKGLSMGHASTAETRPFVVKPHHGGFRSGVDLMKLNQLNDELETEAFLSDTGPGIESKS